MTTQHDDVPERANQLGLTCSVFVLIVVLILLLTYIWPNIGQQIFEYFGA